MTHKDTTNNAQSFWANLDGDKLKEVGYQEKDMDLVGKKKDQSITTKEIILCDEKWVAFYEDGVMMAFYKEQDIPKKLRNY